MILEVRRSSDQELAEGHVFEAGSWMLEAEICQLGARSGLTCVTYLAFVAVLAFLALGRLQESVVGHETESQEVK